MAVERFRRTYYSPEDNIKAVLDELPATATRSIEVEIYGLTDLAFIGALIVAAHRGVEVKAMNDRTQSAGPADHRALQLLVDAGITVKIVRSTHGAIDHLKLCIIDGAAGALDDASSVFYGSYNFSDSAEREDNIAVWSNDPGEVAQAMAKWEADWQHNEQRQEWQLVPSPAPAGR